MGLLDAFSAGPGGLLGSSWDDPKTIGILSAAASLMQAGGPSRMPMNLGQALGQGLTAGMQGYQGAMQDRRRTDMYDMQFKQLKQQQADAQLARDNEAAFRASIVSPQQSMLDGALGDGQGPTMANAAKLAPVDPRNQQLYTAFSLGQMKPMEYLNAITKDRAPIKASEGDVFLDPVTFKQVGAGAPKTASMSDIGKLQAEMNALPPGDPRRNDYVAAIRKATTVAPSTVINNIPRNELGLAPKDQFDMERKLAAEFTARTELDAGIMSTAQDIGNILKQGGALKDQAAIYTFAKALDPKGAVREADYAAIVKTAGGLDYVTSLFNKALTGEQLTPNQRIEMTNLTKAMASVAERRVAKARDRFSKNAKLYQLNPDNIFQGIGEAADDTWAIVPPPGR